MNVIQETHHHESNTNRPLLYMAFELSNTIWKLAFSDGRKNSFIDVPARDLGMLEEGIAKVKNRFGLDGHIDIKSCYEAGRDGFWLHRYLRSKGIDNQVVDSSSIEVNRRKRRAKTDRLDAKKLVQMLRRFWGGESQVWRVVTVPSEEEEDARNLHREMEVLKRDRVRIKHRIKGLLIQQGILVKYISTKSFLKKMDSFQTWAGNPLPPDFKARVLREYERFTVLHDHIKALNREREKRLKEANTGALKRVLQMQQLPGIGINSSWVFVMEFFGWRKFKNRREVAALAGLTPTPYDSGKSRREQGISKAGNYRIRTMSVEIAWCWLRFQPQSKLSKWFNERFAEGGTRMRRIGIVAMARKLLIDLWRFVEHGIVPEGAIVKSA